MTRAPVFQSRLHQPRYVALRPRASFIFFLMVLQEDTYGFLQNLSPVDFREESDALDAFKKTLEPLFGAELVHRHHHLVQNSVDDDLDPDSTFHNVVLAKLADQEGFFFYDYTPASQQTE